MVRKNLNQCQEWKDAGLLFTCSKNFVVVEHSANTFVCADCIKRYWQNILNCENISVPKCAYYSIFVKSTTKSIWVNLKGCWQCLSVWWAAERFFFSFDIFLDTNFLQWTCIIFVIRKTINDVYWQKEENRNLLN